MNRKSYSLLDEGGRKVIFQKLLFGWGQTCKNVHTNQPKTGRKPAENRPETSRKPARPVLGWFQASFRPLSNFILVVVLVFERNETSLEISKSYMLRWYDMLQLLSVVSYPVLKTRFNIRKRFQIKINMLSKMFRNVLVVGGRKYKFNSTIL